MTARFMVGDCREVLASLDAGSVQCVVTSPPYFGLRDYGVVGQIGLESTPDAYVAELVSVFREVRRVLAMDGTLWLNLGDSYASGEVGRHDGKERSGGGRCFGKRESGERQQRRAQTELPSKNLLGIPWRVAFALQADGWYLRSDIIWHKPNPMPESVTDRPTKAHEYLFLLAKSERYYYDAEAIAEAGADSSIARLSQDVESQAGSARANGGTRADRPMRAVARHKQEALGNNQGGYLGSNAEPLTRNRRTVWTVATQPFGEAHFATFPPKLIEPCILAGSRKGETVLDPFGGAGTTALVADRLGRDSVSIELNPAYVEMARNRLANDAGLFADIA